MKRHPQKEDKKPNKTAYIKVRCTAEEKERICSRAANAGRRYSDYCREMLLDGSVIAISPMGDNEKEALVILRHQTALFYGHISNLMPLGWTLRKPSPPMPRSLLSGSSVLAIRYPRRYLSA